MQGGEPGCQGRGSVESYSEVAEKARKGEKGVRRTKEERLVKQRKESGWPAKGFRRAREGSLKNRQNNSRLPG